MDTDDPGLFAAATGRRDDWPIYGHLIDNSWHGSPAEPLPVLAPASGKRFAWLSRGGAAEIDRAVAAARRALAGDWGRSAATERGRLLQRYAALILDHAERLAWIEAHDTGKPISQARADIRAVARYFEFYGGAADKVHGEVIPYLNGYSVCVLREPLGVTAHVIPWNYPSQIFGRTLAPALAMGNATVLKPAEEACLVCLELGQLALRAGFPPGALNIVTGLGEEAGAALSGHAGIDFISFTGSREVGCLIQQAAARHQVPCTLELGGKSPQLVFADADLELAAATICKAITQNSGQTCSAGSRVLIERSIFATFAAMLAERFRSLRVGPPESDPDLGPVINREQYQRILAFIDGARRDRVPTIVETTLPPGLPDGLYVAPMIFGPVAPAHRLVCEEIFGPVLAAQVFDTDDEAVALANGTDYGLVAGLWTRDGSRQQRLARRIVSGQVFINCYGAGGGVELPFGGTKRSGHGREKGRAALEEFSTTKTVVQWHG